MQNGQLGPNTGWPNKMLAEAREACFVLFGQPAHTPLTACSLDPLRIEDGRSEQGGDRRVGSRRLNGGIDARSNKRINATAHTKPLMYVALGGA
jgi:hypothetical protein